jgi:hypothetical protein
MNKGKPTFKWNLYNGEGSIGNIDAFRQLDPLLRCDILNDWIYDLNKEHEQASQELDAYFKEIRAAALAK